jgi:uncharacterized membrane protein
MRTGNPSRSSPFWLWLIWVLTGLAGLLFYGWAQPELRIDVRVETTQLVRVLFDHGLGFVDRAAVEQVVRPGTARLVFPLPADSRSLRGLEIAPVLWQGPTRIERIEFGFPGVQRVWDATTGFEEWRHPDAPPEHYRAGSTLTTVPDQWRGLLLMQDLPSRMDLAPRIYRRRMATIILGWLGVSVMVWLAGDWLAARLGWLLAQVSRPVAAYALLAPVGCAVFLAVLPPFQVADEPGHFFHTWHLSQGRFLPDVVEGYAGGAMPRAYLELRERSAPVFRDTQIRLSPALTGELNALQVDPADVQTVKFPAVSIHSAVAYLPQAIGLTIATRVSTNAVQHVFAGRYANVICCGALTILAIGLAGRWSPCLLVVALLPQTLHQMSTLSADGLTNSLALLCFAIILRWRDQATDSIPFREILIWWGLTTLLAWCKSVYVVWPLLIWLVPARRFQGFRRQFAWFAVGLTAAAISLLLWSHWVKAYWPDPHHWTQDPGSRSRQLAFLLDNPVWFLGATGNSFYRYSSVHLYQLVGSFGWANIPLPLPAVLITSAITLGGLLLLRSVPARMESTIESLAPDGHPVPPVDLKDRLVVLVAMLGTVALMSLGLYLWCTPVGSHTVEGIQARYLIPLLPLLAVLLNVETLGVPPYRPHWRWGIGLIAMYGLIYWISGVTIWNRFYGP